MERFLASLWSQLEADTSITLLTANSENGMDMCRIAVERAVVAHIYYHAMYPNGEADVSRDKVSALSLQKNTIPTRARSERPRSAGISVCCLK